MTRICSSPSRAGARADLPAPTRPAIGSGRSAAFDTGASAAHAATILRASEERDYGLAGLGARPARAHVRDRGRRFPAVLRRVRLSADVPSRHLARRLLSQAPAQGKTPAAADPRRFQGPARPATSAGRRSARSPASADQCGRDRRGAQRPAPGGPAAPANRSQACRRRNRPPAPPRTARSRRRAQQRAAVGAQRSRPPAMRAPREHRRRAPEVLSAEPTAARGYGSRSGSPMHQRAIAADSDAGMEALQRGQVRRRPRRSTRQSRRPSRRTSMPCSGLRPSPRSAATRARYRPLQRALRAGAAQPAAQAGLISLHRPGRSADDRARLKQLIAREPSAILYFSPGQPVRSQARNGHRPSRPTSRPTSCSPTTRTTPTTSRWVWST